MPARVRWENERLYAANRANHIDNLRFVFLRLATGLHPELLRRLWELYEEAISRRLDAEALRIVMRSGPGGVGPPSELTEADVRALVDAYGSFLEPLNLNCWWVRSLATERVRQWEFREHRPDQARGPDWWGWSPPGPQGLLEHNAADPLGVASQPSLAALPAWHPGHLPLSAWMRTVVEAHVHQQQDWARKERWTPLPIGYHPDANRVWTISPQFERQMVWLIRRVVDGHSLATIAKEHRGKNTDRDVQRVTSYLAALLAITWPRPKGGRPKKTPDKSR